jgi:AcrR family transcriptional regulator
MPARRTTPAASTSRERLLETAIELMRGRGFAGVGINDLVHASAAPKGSVYHHFPEGKLQIAREALGLYAQRVDAFVAAALGGAAPPAERVRALFAAFARRAHDGAFVSSCAVGAVGLDLGEDLEPLRPVLAQAFARWADTVARHLDLGEPRRTRAFAGLVLTAIEGAYVRSRVERSRRPFDEAGAWLAELVEQAAAPPGARAGQAR